MSVSRLTASLCLVVASPLCLASSAIDSNTPATIADSSMSSSSVSSSNTAMVDAPSAGSGLGFAAGGQARPVVDTSLRPFSSVAVAAKIGLGGIGFDVATPLSKRFNLRGGASFFSYNTTFTEDGISIVGDLKFRSGSASLDFYPFAGKFRISPGLVFYNGNSISATANVAAGQSFSLNDTDYTSSKADPVHGDATLKLGNKVAPSFTFGFGNMIPRGGGHWSIPVELGFEYIGTPQINLNLLGTACQGTNCQPIQSDPQTKANLIAEQNKLNSDISPLRFFPILSIGVGYKF